MPLIDELFSFRFLSDSTIRSSLSPKLIELEESIVSGEFSKKNQNKSGERSLIRRYKYKIIDEIVSSPITTKRGSDLTANHIIIYKSYAAFKIAASQSRIKLAVELAKDILPKAMRYFNTDVVVDISGYLLRHYRLHTRNNKEIQKYLNIQTEYISILEHERSALDAYSLLGQVAKNKKTKTIDLIVFCDAYYKTNTKDINRHKSYMSQKIYFNISCIGKYYNRDWKELQSLSNHAIEYFNDLDLNAPETLNLFRRHLVRVLLIEKDYISAAKQLEKILNSSDIGTPNWSVTNHMLLVVEIGLENYEEAITIFRVFFNSKGVKYLPPKYLQFWEVTEAYINFLQLTYPELGTRSMSRFRINKFINSRPDLTKSKNHFNIQLLIAQLIFYFYDKNYKRIDERIEAITKYTSRYLKKNTTYRSQIFIKMLVEIPRFNYSRVAIERHTSKFKMKLRDNPLHLDISMDNIEIIPYEHLWEMIMDNLKR